MLWVFCVGLGTTAVHQQVLKNMMEDAKAMMKDAQAALDTIEEAIDQLEEKQVLKGSLLGLIDVTLRP